MKISRRSASRNGLLPQRSIQPANGPECRLRVPQHSPVGARQSARSGTLRTPWLRITRPRAPETSGRMAGVPGTGYEATNCQMPTARHFQGCQFVSIYTHTITVILPYYPELGSLFFFSRCWHHSVACQSPVSSVTAYAPASLAHADQRLVAEAGSSAQKAVSNQFPASAVTGD